MKVLLFDHISSTTSKEDQALQFYQLDWYKIICTRFTSWTGKFVSWIFFNSSDNLWTFLGMSLPSVGPGVYWQLGPAGYLPVWMQSSWSTVVQVVFYLGLETLQELPNQTWFTCLVEVSCQRIFKISLLLSSQLVGMIPFISITSSISRESRRSRAGAPGGASRTSSSPGDWT
jgi:hypothetical protein